MNPFAILVLGYVTIERLVELAFRSRNTKRLRARGARVQGAGH